MTEGAGLPLRRDGPRREPHVTGDKDRLKAAGDKDLRGVRMPDSGEAAEAVENRADDVVRVGSRCATIAATFAAASAAARPAAPHADGVALAGGEGLYDVATSDSIVRGTARGIFGGVENGGVEQGML